MGFHGFCSFHDQAQNSYAAADYKLDLLRESLSRCLDELPQETTAHADIEALKRELRLDLTSSPALSSRGLVTSGSNSQSFLKSRYSKPASVTGRLYVRLVSRLVVYRSTPASFWQLSNSTLVHFLLTCF